MLSIRMLVALCCFSGVFLFVCLLHFVESQVICLSLSLSQQEASIRSSATSESQSAVARACEIGSQPFTFTGAAKTHDEVVCLH